MTKNCLIRTGLLTMLTTLAVSGPVMAATPINSGNSALGAVKIQKDNVDFPSPEIISVTTQNDGKLTAMLNKPISSNDFWVGLVADGANFGKIIKDNTDNIIGFEIDLSVLIASNMTNIADSMAIRVSDFKTGETQDFPFQNQDISMILKNLKMIKEIQPLTSGDKVVNVSATPNTLIQVSRYGVDGTELLASAKSDNTGKCTITLPYSMGGKDVFLISSEGDYGEKDQREVVSEPLLAGENLFGNSVFNNNAEGWETLGADQVITLNGAETDFKIKDLSDRGRHLGAMQFKNGEFLGKYKISLDIKVNSLLDDELKAIYIGGCAPGGGLAPGRYLETPITSKDVGVWKHIEYVTGTNGLPLEPFGFTTYGLNDIDVKNVTLILE